MPIYEYKCTVCAEHLDIEQSITEDTLTSLPGCAVADDAEHKLKKVFSAVGISFKGDGFYRNDSRPPKTSATKDSGSDNGSTNGSSESSDSSSASTTKDSASGSSGGDSGSGSSGSKAPAGSSSSAD